MQFDLLCGLNNEILAKQDKNKFHLGMLEDLVDLPMSPAPSLPLKVFYSYSRRDKKWLLRLQNQLKNLERQHLIIGFCDREIPVGTNWDFQIRSEVEKADIFLLLITENFIGSEYCYDIEMKRALERHVAGEALVIPVAVDYCDWIGAAFAPLQAIPDPATPIVTNPSKLLRDVAQRVRETVTRVAAGQAIHGLASGHQQAELKLRRDVPWLLPHLCNRSLQEQALFTNLQAHGPGQHRPYVLVVHGARGEAHEGFIERLQQDLLPRVFNNVSAAVRPLPPLEWPIYVKDGTTAKQMIAPILAKSLDAHPFADLSELAELLVAFEGMTVLTMTVDTDAWAATGEEVFKKFLQFWQEWPDIRPHRVLVICVIIKYDVSHRNNQGEVKRYDRVNKHIIRSLEEATKEKYPNINFVMLPTLTAVGRLDVEVFVKKKEVQKFLNSPHALNWIADVASLYKEHFQIPMEELVSHLEDMLGRYAR